MERGEGRGAFRECMRIYMYLYLCLCWCLREFVNVCVFVMCVDHYRRKLAIHLESMNKEEPSDMISIFSSRACVRGGGILEVIWEIGWSFEYDMSLDLGLMGSWPVWNDRFLFFFYFLDDVISVFITREGGC